MVLYDCLSLVPRGIRVVKWGHPGCWPRPSNDVHGHCIPYIPISLVLWQIMDCDGLLQRVRSPCSVVPAIQLPELGVVTLWLNNSDRVARHSRHTQPVAHGLDLFVG